MARRLAAILAADVVGFSRLMEVDESGTLASLKAHRADLIDPLIAEHSGRIVKLMGDGVLVEFGSVVDAVECAVAVQQGMAQRNGNVDDNERIDFRIGVNLGDVIVEGDDIYGDGVNVAARLEGLAEPGGICLSGMVHDNIAGKLDHVFTDGGEQAVKNISRPVRVWRWPETEPGSATSTDGNAAPSLPDKPTIAVLPFVNMSGDEEQEYFSDGLTEDIITELSRFRSVLVIARNSSFHYKGTSPKVQDVGRDLGAAYVVEGSVRKAGNRVRVTAQLVESDSGNHVWAERYDRDLEDIFAVQDDLTRTVASTVAGHIEVVGHRHASRMSADKLRAYDLVLRARRQTYEFTQPGNVEAQGLLARAIALDPANARAHAALCSAHVLGWISHWAKDSDAARNEAHQLAKKAVALDETDCYAQWNLGLTYLILRRYDNSRFHLEQALALNPNDVEARALYGLFLTYNGQAEDALTEYEQAQEVDPYHLTWLPWYEGFTNFTALRFDETIEKLEPIEHPLNEVRGLLAASYAYVGRLEEARVMLNAFLRAGENEMVDFPGHSAAAWTQNWNSLVPYRNDSDREIWATGWRKAGLPA